MFNKMVWTEVMDFETFMTTRSYDAIFEVEEHKKYRLNIGVLVDSFDHQDVSTWEITVADKSIGRCKPICENNESIISLCNEECVFFDCSTQLDENIVHSLEATKLEVKLTMQTPESSSNMKSCFCNKLNWKCNKRDDGFEDFSDIQSMIDVANITLNEIGK